MAPRDHKNVYMSADDARLFRRARVLYPLLSESRIVWGGVALMVELKEQEQAETFDRARDERITGERQAEGNSGEAF